MAESEEDLRRLIDAMREDAERQSAEYSRMAATHEARLTESARRIRSLKLAGIMVSLVGASVAMVGVTSQFLGWESNRSSAARAISFLPRDKFASKEDLEGLRASYSNATKMLDSAFNNLDGPTKANDAKTVELSVLKSTVNVIDERLKVLERSISDNPEKALSIPMLRKDQENMAKSIDSNKLAVSEELTRIYDQQKWILGGIGTVLFAAITALLSVLYKMFFKGRDSD